MGSQEKYAYILEVHCTHLRAEITLNDWLAYRVDDEERRTLQLRLNPWVIEGDNPFAVKLGPLEPGPVPDEAGFLVRVYKGPVGERTTFDDVLVTYLWKPELSPLDNKALREVFRHTFRVRKAFGPFAWQRALPFGDQDRPAITALVQQFRDAIAAKDEAAVLGMLDTYLEEMARALQLDKQYLADKVVKRLQFFFADDPVTVAPIDLDRLLLEPSAGGRLVQIWAEDRSPPVAVDFGVKAYENFLAVSNLGGQWTVVR